ncbi:MAG: hypothetical protein V4466_04005, partial [Pseudomonadota bacterium]
LNKSVTPAPGAPSTSTPAPLTAPAPQVRQPLGGSTAPGSAADGLLGTPAPAAPATAPQQ